MRPPTPEEAASLTVPGLLQRIREHPSFSLQRPATAAELAAGQAAWWTWFGIGMPAVYRDLLAVTNGLNYNGLFLFAAVEHTEIDQDRPRWMPGIESENTGYLWDSAEEETRRFFGSADDDLFAYDTRSRTWLVVPRSDWSGDPYAEFGTLEALLVDRMFHYLDEAEDEPAG